MKWLLATSSLAIVVAVASVSSSRDARGQPVEEAQTSTGSVNSERTDASDINIDEADQPRLRAEYARLKVEHDALEARLASLEAEAAEERQRQLSLGPWEVLGLYWLLLALAVLWSWRGKGGRLS
jgi:uncharacterized protein YhaN